MCEQPLQRAEVKPRGTADLVEVPIFGGLDGGQQLAVTLVGATDDTAQHWDENQRHGQRGRERYENSDRQKFHELADNPWPEEQGQKHDQRGGGRGCLLYTSDAADEEDSVD